MSTDAKRLAEIEKWAEQLHAVPGFGIVLGTAEGADVLWLLAALRACPESPAWQPIATYEHGERADMGDGVLIAVDGGLVGEAYFNPKSGGGTWWWSGTHDGEYADSPIYSPVTHWQPLPPPPTALKEHD